MIDIEKAKQAFKEYVSNYNLQDDKINLKIVHTYHVIDFSEYIAKDIGLKKEEIDLAKLIALLHDIGRFEQLRIYNDYNDLKTVDHAELGADILFKEKRIRDFIKEDCYDDIIEHAIRNHNKYRIDKSLKGRVLLHTKLIRDADKADNFRVKEEEKLETIFNVDKEALQTDDITDEIYNDIMNHTDILSSKRKTYMDIWVSFIAMIFDFNFNSGLKYIKENNYINRSIDRNESKNEDTKRKLENIRKCAIEYVEKRCKEENKLDF